jgi:hypothetical protein
MTIYISSWCCGQESRGTPVYAKTLSNLFKLDHKAYSYNPKNLSVITISELESKTNKEDVVVYFVYEVYSEFEGNRFKPISTAKLMDIYIVYDYCYKIYFTNDKMLKVKTPMITIPNGSTLSKLTIKNYFKNEEGVIESKQLKKSAYKTENVNGLFSMQIDDNSLVDGSILEIHAKVISKNFHIIQPSISNADIFEKSLILSFPTIFKYNVPEFKNYELISQTTAPFILLNFMRPFGNRNGEIEKVNSDSNIYTWKISKLSTTNLNPEFELNEFMLDKDTDIGMEKEEILKKL